MSTNPEQKCRSEKKPNKKYQKFKNKQEQGTTKSVGKFEIEFKNVNSSELSKVKHSEKGNESKIKPPLPNVAVESKLNETVPGSRNPENFQKNEKDTSERKNMLHSISENAFTVSTRTNSEEVKKENPGEMNKVKKANSSKPVPVPYRNPYKKKRTEPLLISFQDILSARKTKRNTREHNIHKTKVQRLKNKEVLSGNFLDASNPKRSRGKHREIKKAKLSNLKLTIIKERIIKHKIKEMGVDGNVEWCSLVDKVDFNTEIKAYLNKLENIKVKNSCKCKNSVNLNDKNVTKEAQDVENTVKKESLEISTSKVEEDGENSKAVVQKLKGKQTSEVQGREEIKFSAKFREYCDNFVTPELNSAVSELIKGLINLQDRLFFRDPIKAKVKRRHVSGLREVRKYLILRKVKMIIIAPNLEKLQMEGSIYDSINELKSMADSQNVVYGFALDRYRLGRCTKKNVPVSAFAVLSYEGIEALYEEALQHLMEAKRTFSELAKANDLESNEKKDENLKVISTLTSALLEGLKVSGEVQVKQEDCKL